MTPLAARLSIAVCAVCAVLPLTSCVTAVGPGPAPIPLGGGVFALGNALGSDGENHQRAIGFCFEQGRQVLRLSEDGVDLPGRPGEFRFRCVGPGEPGWKEPAG